MEKRLDKMEKVNRPDMDDKNMKLDFIVGDWSGKDLIDLVDVGKSFGETGLFRSLNHSFKYGDRTGIIGNNGSGKTTILKLILGEVKDYEGIIKRGTNVKIGYLQQNIKFSDEEASIVDNFREGYICSEEKARNILAGFLFYGQDVFKKVKLLSGGERARLRLCQLMYRDTNTLILDEPTNHLDIASLEMLEENLLNFKGSIIFVSHDRYFINRIATEVLDLSEGAFISYKGNFDYYMEKRAGLIKDVKEEKLENEKIKETTDYEINKKENSLKRSNMKRIEKLEINIEKYENLIRIKNLEIEENARDYEKLTSLYEEKLDLERELNGFMNQWVDLNERI